MNFEDQIIDLLKGGIVLNGTFTPEQLRNIADDLEQYFESLRKE